MPGCGACTDATHVLDSGVGTTILSPRTVYIARGVDFSNTVTHTGFLELAEASTMAIASRLQGFVDTLSNDRFVSYGFPGSYRTLIVRDAGALRFQPRFRRAQDRRISLGAS